MNTIIHKLNYELSFNHFYIKRDDLIPHYYGGNKVRILQAYYEDMLEKECNCLIAYGSTDSNMCRAAALMCSEKGLPCFLVYGRDADGEAAGCRINDHLAALAGAEILNCRKSEVKQTIELAFRRAESKGYKPYYIFGDSSGRGNERAGVQGYISCYDEIQSFERENDFRFDYIFITSGTGITQSGLLAGKTLRKGVEKIVGISIARERRRQEEQIAYCLKQFFEGDTDWDEGNIEVYDGCLQGGYGKITACNQQFILNFWKRNSIPLDRTYVGKGLFGMVQYLDERHIKGKNILFIHTGATPMFYEDVEAWS